MNPYADLNDLADELAAAWRAEIADQRAADAHLIVDPRPTRAELEETVPYGTRRRP